MPAARAFQLRGLLVEPQLAHEFVCQLRVAFRQPFAVHDQYGVIRQLDREPRPTRPLRRLRAGRRDDGRAGLRCAEQLDRLQIERVPELPGQIGDRSGGGGDAVREQAGEPVGLGRSRALAGADSWRARRSTSTPTAPAATTKVTSATMSRVPSTRKL